MSRNIESTALRTLALVSTLVAAGLVVPAVGHAQAFSAERTLLNHIAVPAFARAQSNVARAAPAEPGVPAGIDGAQALLAQTPAREREELEPVSAAIHDPAGQIDGESALLGRAQSRRREGGSK
jgi:hypothetical protein